MLESKACVLTFMIEQDYRSYLSLTWPTADAPWHGWYPRTWGHADNPGVLTTSLNLDEVVDAIDPNYVFLTRSPAHTYEGVRDRVCWLCETFRAFCEPLTRGTPEPWREILAKVKQRREYWSGLPNKLRDEAFRDEFRSEAAGVFARGNYYLAKDMYDTLVHSGFPLTLAERLRRWQAGRR